ncbi:MAG: hypothetical protein E7645_08295 [Ruminococcaceae bacterium]|nr:hypothetical protein [Oscillospiraceae bacterium]
MENINQTAADRAADKLHKEAEAVSKLKGSGYPIGIMRELSGPICSMLVRFCYQEEDFAQSVLNQKDKLQTCLERIVKLSSREKPVVSDLDAYAEAVRFYIPEGKVTMSCRVVIPVVRDDDLLDLGTVDDDPEDGAIILELPMID